MSLVEEILPASQGQAFLVSTQTRGKAWYRPYVAVLVAVDLLAIAVAAGVAGAANGGTSLPANGSVAEGLLVPLAFLVGFTWVGMLAVNGAYKPRWLGLGSEEYRRVLETGWRSLALIALTTFLLGATVSRGFVVLTVTVATVTSLTLRYALRRRLHAGRALGKHMKRVLVVGSRSACTDVVARLLAAPHAGFLPVGACCGDAPRDLLIRGTSIPVLGAPGRALHVALTIQADAIAVVDLGSLSHGELGSLAERVEGSGIELLVSREATEVAGPRMSLQPLSELALVRIEEPRLKGVRRVIKSTADRVLALAAIVALAPVLAAVGLVVRATSRGPAIFRQTRVGLGGRHFTLWKFRSMTQDAEAGLLSVLHLNEHDGPLFKVRDDPRVTRVGRFLRRWSLDELPQLWNVLRGDMSIVGPRPPIPSEVARYDDQIRHRLLVKPGITGLWQVSGRARLPWDEAVRLDLHYVENWSLSMDAVILLRTGLAVLRREGAY